MFACFLRLCLRRRMSSARCFFFFFKQKTAYEMRISDWSSDVCSSDLDNQRLTRPAEGEKEQEEDDADRRRHHPHHPLSGALRIFEQIGRASCRGRVCQYV